HALVEACHRRGEGGDDLVLVDVLLGAHGLIDLGALGDTEMAGYRARRDDRVLARDHLLAPARGNRGHGYDVDVCDARPGQRGEQLEVQADEAGVVGIHVRLRGRAVVDRGPEPGQLPKLRVEL